MKKKLSGLNSVGSQGKFSRILLIFEEPPQFCAVLPKHPLSHGLCVHWSEKEGLETLQTSVQPLSFVTAVVLFLSDVTPPLPGTSQRPVQTRTHFHRAVFPSPPCSGEISKFSCWEISGATPGWPQGEKCALISLLNTLRHFIWHGLLGVLSILSQSWIDLVSFKLFFGTSIQIYCTPNSYLGSELNNGGLLLFLLGFWRFSRTDM